MKRENDKYLNRTDLILEALDHVKTEFPRPRLQIVYDTPEEIADVVEPEPETPGDDLGTQAGTGGNGGNGNGGNGERQTPYVEKASKLEGAKKYFEDRDIPYEEKVVEVQPTNGEATLVEIACRTDIVVYKDEVPTDTEGNFKITKEMKFSYALAKDLIFNGDGSRAKPGSVQAFNRIAKQKNPEYNHRSDMMFGGESVAKGTGLLNQVPEFVVTGEKMYNFLRRHSRKYDMGHKLNMFK